MEEIQQINIGTGQDLSAIANQPTKVNFETINNTFNPKPTFDDDGGPTIDAPADTFLPMNYEDPEMRKQHKQLVKKLWGYANSTLAKWGILSEYELSADILQTQTIEALENLLEDVKYVVGMSNSATFSVDMFKKWAFTVLRLLSLPQA